MTRVLLHPDSFSAGKPPALPPLGTKPAMMPSRPVGAPLGAIPGSAPGATADPGGLPDDAPPKIRAFDQRLSAGGKHEDSWKRSPNVTGTGAIHVRSFHCKLTGDSLENLDRQINEWLDAHPQYEVKFVTSSVGEWLGKLREPNLIIQVWV